MFLFELILILFQTILLLFLIYDNNFTISPIRHLPPAVTFLLSNIISNYLLIPILLKIIIISVLTILSLYSTHIMNLKQGTLLISTYIFCLSFCDIITLEICDIIYQNCILPLRYNILVLITNTLLSFSVSLIIRKIMSENLFKLSIQSTIPLFIIITSDVLFIIIMGSIVTVVDPTFTFYLFTITIFVFIIIIINLALLMHFLHCKEIEYNNNMDIAKLEINYKYYKSKVEDDLKISELIHDFKNHILILESQISVEQKKNYINNLKRTISDYDNKYDTGNNYLNIILNEKSSIACTHNIMFDFQMYLDEFNILTPEDLCSLFGNAIDNAIEACLKITIDNPYIKIRINKKGNFIIIVFSNTSATTTLSTTTTKPDASRHGFGLKSIEKCIKKYDGTIQIQCKNYIFNLFVLIPYE